MIVIKGVSTGLLEELTFAHHIEEASSLVHIAGNKQVVVYETKHDLTSIMSHFSMA